MMGGGGGGVDHQAQGVTALLGAETGRISPAALCGLPQPGGSLREKDEENEYRDSYKVIDDAEEVLSEKIKIVYVSVFVIVHH